MNGQRYPFYYSNQPTGRYPDQPFVEELYYEQLFRSGAKQVPIVTLQPLRSFRRIVRL